MAAQRSSVNDPPWALPTEVIYLAQTGMGRNLREAQELAAEAR